MDSSSDNEFKIQIESKSITTEPTSADSAPGDDDISTTSSDEALCDVLGLPSLFGMGMVEEVGEECRFEKTAKCDFGILNPSRIDIPSTRGVSRKYYPPAECFAYEIENVLSPEECSELIKVAATSSHTNNSQNNPSSFRYITHAVHTAPDGKTKFEVKLERPNPHKLAVFRHESWVKLLWERIEPLFHNSQDDHTSLNQSVERFIRREELSGSSRISPIAGLNPRLRVLKYDACDEDEFQGHFDATTEIHSLGQTSYLTVLLYLNNGGGKDFDGGETEFLSQEQKGEEEQTTKITPRAGSVVLFEHDLFHRGRPLLWGTKYVLRTDIMFINSQKTPADTSANNPTIDPSPNATNDDFDPDELLSTVEDVICRIEEELQFNKDDDDCHASKGHESDMTLLRNALSEGLGFGEDLRDTTIDCLCSPGRFALNLVLREYMQQNHHQQIIDRFLNASFEALATRR